MIKLSAPRSGRVRHAHLAAGGQHTLQAGGPIGVGKDDGVIRCPCRPVGRGVACISDRYGRPAGEGDLLQGGALLEPDRLAIE